MVWTVCRNKILLSAVNRLTCFQTLENQVYSYLIMLHLFCVSYKENLKLLRVFQDSQKT